jgi:NADH:ubiquinone oxidoreductase subunit H
VAAGLPFEARVKVTTLRYALIGMAALAALEFYAMMVGGGAANG